MDNKHRQDFKLYLEYNDIVREIKKKIFDLELEKEYIMDTLKAMTITDMPTSDKKTDISDTISKTEIINSLILDQILKLQCVHNDYSRISKVVDMLTDDEKKVLEGRVYNKQVFVISRKINVCNQQFYNIRSKIKEKIGIDI